VPRNRSDEPHIGKYRLIKTIGKGNFAKVKLAKHVPTGKEVITRGLLIFHPIGIYDLVRTSL
jgi:serine/threonine protein kinase